MTTALTIHGWGAVTPVGLTAAQTCAAIRAKITGFRELVFGLPPEEPQLAAPVPAKWTLRRTPADWLSNLASKAVAECLRDERPNSLHTVLLVALPEDFRQHPAALGLAERPFIRRIESRLRLRFHPRSGLLSGGPASVFQALGVAQVLFKDPSIHYCIVGGTDSFVNHADIQRLRVANRLHNSSNPQGLVPGEGASFLLVSPNQRWRTFRPLAQVLGVGSAVESETVLGPKFSVGQGTRSALSDAVAEIDGGEPSLEFVTSTFNGERYGAWESLIARTRFYRTRKERIEVIYPAMSVGEIGTAAPALTAIVAATAIARGYAPGTRAMCEASSDEGLRAACVIGPSPEPPAFSGPGLRASKD
jgi:3-oxoacyl-[acyl-carrier-protein] synthase-1